MMACTNAFHRAIRQGEIKRGDTCTFCGCNDSIEGAHTDYSKPLDVIWLCRKCHRIWDHANPKTKMNNRIEFTVLDSSDPPFKRPTIDDLREMVANVSKEPPIEHAPQRPLIFRDDYGQIISERQWNILQQRKEKAKAGGYVLDDYSQ